MTAVDNDLAESDLAPTGGYRAVSAASSAPPPASRSSRCCWRWCSCSIVSARRWPCSRRWSAGPRATRSSTRSSSAGPLGDRHARQAAAQPREPGTRHRRRRPAAARARERDRPHLPRDQLGRRGDRPATRRTSSATATACDRQADLRAAPDVDRRLPATPGATGLPGRAAGPRRTRRGRERRQRRAAGLPLPGEPGARHLLRADLGRDGRLPDRRSPCARRCGWTPTPRTCPSRRRSPRASSCATRTARRSPSLDGDGVAPR